MISSAVYKLTSSYTRNFPLRKGKGRIMKMILKSPLKPYSCITESNDGRLFEFDSRSGLNLEIFFYGVREPEETALMRKVIGEGDTVLDVGANAGWYTTLFSKQIGDSGKVYAIEPVPDTFKALKRTVEINHCTENVLLFNKLCGENEEPGTIFQFPDLHPGLSSARPIGNEKTVEHRIDTITIDNLVARENIKSVAMLKIDVEGAELQVLRGALKSLRAGIIKGMLLEVNEERATAFGYDFGECLDLIIRANDFQFVNTSSLVESRTASSGKMNYKNGDNLLIVLNGSEQQRRLEFGSKL